MLYASKNVSTRTLLKLTAVLLLLAGAWPALANSGNPPQLIPYTMSSLAGNTQYAYNGEIGGYGGDGGPGSGATLNAPEQIAVDSVGNVYFTDNSNAVIREINAQTGLINLVAGAPPTNCTGTICHPNTGCSDGVLAARSPIEANMQGLVIDAYGNLYFDDGTTQTVSVVYRGGAQVAAFISLVNPSGVAKAGGVLPGYVYHVAGTVNLGSCAGTTTKAATSTSAAIPAGDGQLAYNGGGTAVGVTFGQVTALGLDSAGNLFIGDGSPNSVIRVINTQTNSTQYFFGKAVPPGYIASIVNCGSLTTICPPGGGSTPATVANTGQGGPAGGAEFNTLATGQGGWMVTDAYGNVYELNYKGGSPFMALGVAYAGGAPLAKLINQALIGENLGTTPSIAGLASQLANPVTPYVPGTNPPSTATGGVGVGDFYYLLTNITLRASSITNDTFGNLYYLDDHYGQIYRVDANAVPYAADWLEVSYLTSSGLTSDSNRTSVASNAVPGFCYPVGGQSTTNPVVADYITYDQFGNGCPVIQAEGIGVPHSGNGYGTTIADGPGNLFIADRTNDQIRKVSLNNIFPNYPVGQALNTTTLVGQQSLQFHFDQGNLPVQTTPAPMVTTTSFAMAPGIPDFTISPIESQYTTGTNSGITIGPTGFTYSVIPSSTTSELPVCANVTGSADLSLDCVINVIFSPTAPGLRQGRVQVTTANGSVYNYGLTGVGTGPQLAIEGGAPATVALTGLGNTGQVAVTQWGTIYVADPANNRVVVLPSGTGATQATIGTGLKSPMGVAVDASGNVFISDTGNNRIVEVNQITGAQTVLGAILAASGPAGTFGSTNANTAYTQYAFNAPEGIAVDQYDNVYVADTGNAKVVEIPFNPTLGGATPLLQYPGAPTFSAPVAVALDSKGNLYVADPGNIQIVEIPAGGGDLQNLPGATLKGFGAILTAPSGVAVDAAGNVYVSDSGTNQVYELPSASGLTAVTLPLNFTGLNLTGSAPAATSYVGGSLALDASGNIYLSDPGNGRILFDNRQNPTITCGTQPQGQSPVACGTAPFNGAGAGLTITNIGNAPQTITLPFASVQGTANPAFALTTNTCTSTTLLPGAYCSIVPTFQPGVNGAQTESISINGSSTQLVSLTGTGENVSPNIVLSNTPTTGTGTAGSPIVVTATLSQPVFNSVAPTNNVSFSYTVDGVSAGAATAVPLTVSGHTSTATFTIPATSSLTGRTYVLTAVYSGDNNFSGTTPPNLTIQVPGTPVTATATPVSYIYGQPVPALVGTVTGILAADNVTYSFATPAGSKTAVGVYPINVVFSGGNHLNYGSGSYPPVYATGSSTTLATVTENAAPLKVVANSATTLYGAPNLSFTSTLTGLVSGDKLAETYTPPQSSILNVGTYPIVPTVIGKATGNYTVTVTNGTLTVTQAPTGISVSPTATSVLNTTAALSADTITIAVGTAVPGGNGTPTGKIEITDVFTPITSYAPGGGAQQLAALQGQGTTSLAPVVLGPFALNGGTYVYTPTNTTPGTHSYSVVYSGDSNFTCSSQLSSAQAAAYAGTLICPVASTATGTVSTIIVDTADFTVSAPSSPILIGPGVLPTGSGATPEEATMTISSVLNFAGTVYYSCIPQNPDYTTCAVVEPAVTVAAGKTIASILSVQSPATLPLNFNFNQASLRGHFSNTVLALLPFGALAFCLRRRRRLSKALWMAVTVVFMSAGLNGCGGNLVHFFTPIPSGTQTLTVYACSVQSSCPTISILGTITSGSTSVTAVSNTAGLTVGGSVIAPQIGFTGNVTSGSTTVSGVTSTFELASGVGVSGAGIPVGTTITAVTPATATTAGSITLSTAATATAGSVALTEASPIPAGTTIVSVTPGASGAAGTMTLSAPALGSGTVGLSSSVTSTGLTRSFTFQTLFE